mgnify:CR=1 FL=1
MGNLVERHHAMAIDLLGLVERHETNVTRRLGLVRERALDRIEIMRSDRYQRSTTTITIVQQNRQLLGISGMMALARIMIERCLSLYLSREGA